MEINDRIINTDCLLIYLRFKSFHFFLGSKIVFIHFNLLLFLVKKKFPFVYAIFKIKLILVSCFFFLTNNTSFHIYNLIYKSIYKLIYFYNVIVNF